MVGVVIRIEIPTVEQTCTLVDDSSGMVNHLPLLLMVMVYLMVENVLVLRNDPNVEATVAIQILIAHDLILDLILMIRISTRHLHLM